MQVNNNSFEKTITVSIVSHGHDDCLVNLLSEIAATSGGVVAHVIVTHNCPGEPIQAPDGGWPFAFLELENAAPVGFGANHNRAFRHVKTRLFCILNPDVSISDSALWQTLAQVACGDGLGCAFPALVNADGSRQDNARMIPTPWALFKRRIFNLNDRRVEWASAAFWVLPSAVFAQLKGFDTRYHMYCEDVDFCLRVQSQHLRLAGTRAFAVHHAQRSSHHDFEHLVWHMRSLFRLWLSTAMWRYLWSRTLLRSRNTTDQH